MCGICGILEFNSKKAVEENALRAMNQTLVHRGPDDWGIYLKENVGLGNRRLSIIDLATGHQPIHNEDRSLWIVSNGEIYNFQKLREELEKRGHQFYTRSDTETVLHLYEEEEEECLKKLDGMFALAIWDEKKKYLFLARDPLGKKPLCWAIFGNKFIFASEIKGILAYPGFKKELDSKSLAKYLLYGFIPAPATIFKGIRKLLPGHFMVVGKNSKIKEEKYWELDYSSKIEDLSREEIKKKVVVLLQEAIKKRLISDVPLGVFLSGGVDSSIVVALMTKIISPSQIQAFSIGFKEKGFDESPYAKLVAKHLGIDHHLKIFSQEEISEQVLKIVQFLDEPMADPSLLPTLLLSSFTQKGVKVALSGDGGDENFAGYPKYLAHWFLKKTSIHRLPLYLLANLFSGKIKTFLRYSSYPLHLRNQLWISPFSLQEVENLTGKKMELFEDIRRYHKAFNGKDALDEAFFLDIKLTLSDLYLVKTDRASMATSLEVRCPFLDRKLVEFCAQIPARLKLKGFKTKSLLKEIAGEFLPREVVFRPKMGLGIPLARWLQKELKPLVSESLSLQKIKKEGILNPEKVERTLNRNNPHQIWTLLVFEQWLERWM